MQKDDRVVGDSSWVIWAIDSSAQHWRRWWQLPAHSGPNGQAILFAVPLFKRLVACTMHLSSTISEIYSEISVASDRFLTVFVSEWAFLPHFAFPWVRPWDNRGNCHTVGRRIQCLSNASQHVSIYLQPFLRYNKLLVENCDIFTPPLFSGPAWVTPLEWISQRYWYTQN